eukprot:Blabericola_migrator_1__6059@NODE_3057_length_2072_cov_479_059850_g162_i2_p1_GENE_NODE_3057_length_2072_cov_479_059850_g162_i2NODE_3057_length_2072_cov_479_059850_g162_i2_p1_ORF_typecomplete_len251_score32_70Exostosin/PF03016_15/1_1e08_NODE_3057_length_2072_cov_479_059850_g162_i2141893
MIQNRKIKWAFVGQADWRDAYTERRQLLIHNISDMCRPDEGHIFSRHGEGDEILPPCPSRLYPDGNIPSMCQCQYPAGPGTLSFDTILTDSIYAFHIRGDNFYSARIADILGAGAIPVVVDHTMLLGMSGQCHVPVKDIAIWVPHDEWMQNPAQATLKAVLQKSHSDMEKMLRLLQYYRSLLLHGLYGNNRIVEDRLRHMVLRCLSEDLLNQLNATKADMTCDFEDVDLLPAFPTIGDIDDVDSPMAALF